jgi:hypothetical protein
MTVVHVSFIIVLKTIACLHFWFMFGGRWWGRSMDMEQETDMNKIIAVAIAAGGLLFLGSPEAAAHTEVRFSYEPSTYYRYDVRRTHAMPRWLRRDKAFRHWYKHTPLRKHKHLTWHRLFSIYRWENVEQRGHLFFVRVSCL